VLKVLYHHAKFGEAWISPAAGAAKNVEFFFVCLSVGPIANLKCHYFELSLSMSLSVCVCVSLTGTSTLQH